MPSAICFSLDQSEVLSSGNGLNVFTGFFSHGQEILGEYGKEIMGEKC